MGQEAVVADQVAEERGTGYKILVVDDDRLILGALEQTIQREGYEILTASNGEAAIKILQQHPVALIICDQRMPGISGVEVLQQAETLAPDAIRILLTGNSDLATAMKAINIGHVSQFIEKPWDDSQLRHAVHASIEKFKLVKENQKLQQTILTQHQQLAKTHATLRQELALGALIHQTLLVGKCPQGTPHFSIAATSIPSKDIDGDFLEFYQPCSEVLDLAIGDVMGKGIPAALVGTAVKTQMLRFAMPFASAQVFDRQGFWQDDLLAPTEILERVQREITPQLIDLEYFVSLFYGRFNSCKKTFSYVDCGSTKPIHYRAAEKRAFELSGENLPLGIIPNDKYVMKEVGYDKDDIFVFYSDGVTEAHAENLQLFGNERLVNIISENSQNDAPELLEKIKNSVLTFAQKDYFEDDLTIIVIKVKHDEGAEPLHTTTGKFNSDLSQLKAVRDFVWRLCRKAPGDVESLTSQVQLAINEAFCNIVEHSYNGQKGNAILVHGELRHEGLFIEISDQGITFDPTTVREPSLVGDEDGGFGWYLIRDIADKLTYLPKKSDTGWNHLKVFKRYIFKEDEMQFAHTNKDNILIITPEIDTLDAKEAPEFKTKVIDLISANPSQQVVFDLHRLQFIDSSGLGTFLAVLRVLNTRGGELKLCRLNKPIRTMFELVSMHKIFEIFNSPEEAVRSFK